MERRHYLFIIVVEAVVIVVLAIRPDKKHHTARVNGVNSKEMPLLWTAPDTNEIPEGDAGRLIRYGRELIVNTAMYFGPRGKISQAANGLNCQNCHIDAGTRLFGNNFSKAAVAYPQYRARRNRYISLADRINGCMERSMNGQAIDTTGREMKAFMAYLMWIGQGVDKKGEIYGEGTEALAFMERAADQEKGKIVFMTNCGSCHGKDGAGKLNDDSTEYLYPPLWGPHSYNTGAGLYRISKFASYVKNNMPFGTTYHNPVLTDEQAWDVAAFVDSQPHPPFKEIKKDWPKTASKPFDYPFGPYADSLSERKHKYGPFKPSVK